MGSRDERTDTMEKKVEGGRIGQAFWACLLALALVMTYGFGAWLAAAEAEADDETGYTITVSDATTGTYSAYQLMTGSFSSDDAIGDIVLNSSYTDTLVSALGLTASDYSTDTALANAVADALAALDSSEAQSLANTLAGSITDGAVSTTTLESAGTATLTVSATGYYLVTQTSSDDAVTSAILVAVDGDETVSAKTSTPTVTKTVVTDSETGAAITYNSDGTAAISYTVTGTLPSNYADYSSYSYSFVDTMPSGIEVTDGDVTTTSITAGETDLSSLFSTSYTTDDDGNSVVTWACSDLTQATAVTAGSSIVLAYTVTLSSEEVAKITSGSITELANSIEIVYSSSPYSGSSSLTATSAADTDTIQLYTLELVKTDESNNTLSGAAFSLASDNGYSLTGLTTDSTIGGLEAGVSYTLTETTTPDGYKSSDPVVFSITAATDSSDASVTESSDPSSVATFAISGTTVTATIVNYAGVDLPLTGQQGIILGLIVGGALILISAIALSRRRRDEAAE